MRIAAGLFIALLVSGCAAKNPLENLGQEHKTFLFGDDESNIAFMGDPLDSKSLSCDPRQMRQGYIFKIEEKRIIIESIRPSGTVQHIIREIVDAPDKITIKAMNGANIPFSMVFSDLKDNGASISQDGEENKEFIRCIK